MVKMPVPEAAFDVVICSMAYTWFPRKAEATAAMADPAPRRHSRSYAPAGAERTRTAASPTSCLQCRWVGAFDGDLRDVPEMEEYIEAAGLEPVDIWMETRMRHTPVEEYMERMRVVASHLHAEMPDELAAMRAQVEAATREVSGPRGFEYTFTKLFAIARKPEV